MEILNEIIKGLAYSICNMQESEGIKRERAAEGEISVQSVHVLGARGPSRDNTAYEIPNLWNLG